MERLQKRIASSGYTSRRKAEELIKEGRVKVNGKTEELQFDKRDNPMIYETKDFIRLIKEHKVDHQFLRSSEIEMDITDEVRRQTGIVFPADKIREQ